MPRGRSPLGSETLAQLRLPRDLCISPDGSLVVFAAARADLQRDRICHALLLVEVRSGRMRPLTSGAHDDRDPCFAPDGQSLVFVSDRDGTPNLWRLRFDATAPEPLTHLDGAVRSPRLSPGGKAIAFLHAPETPRHRGAHGTSARIRLWKSGEAGPKVDGLVDETWAKLCVLELRTRRLRRLGRGMGHDTEPAWSPDGRSLAFVSHRSASGAPRGDSELWVVSSRGGPPRRLGRQRGPKHSPAWSPEGTAVAYVGANESATAADLHVWVVPARGGQAKDVLAASELMCADVCAADLGADRVVHAPAWSADGEHLYFLGSQDGAVNVFALPAAGGSPVARTSGRHEIGAFVCSTDRRVWALLRATPTEPGDVYAATFPLSRRGSSRGPFHVHGARVRRLTHLHAAALRGKRLVRPEEFRLTGPQGPTLHGFLFRGRRRRGPAVLALQAGPGTMAGASYVHEWQLLAAAGYQVICPNLRGCAGYGTEFRRSLRGKWGFEDLHDLHRVADWAASRAFVDGRRLALLGRGHGAFLAHWALGHTRRFRCAVTTAGAAHFASLFGNSDTGRALEAEFLAPPWESHERYWRTSPLAYVEHLRAPLLLLHGEDDRHCPASQSRELFAALARLGREVEWVCFTGEGHDFERHGRPLSRIERLRRVLDWLERKL